MEGGNETTNVRRKKEKPDKLTPGKTNKPKKKTANVKMLPVPNGLKIRPAINGQYITNVVNVRNDSR